MKEPETEKTDLIQNIENSKIELSKRLIYSRNLIISELDSKLIVIDKLLHEIKKSEQNHHQYTTGKIKNVIDDDIKFYQKTIESINAFRSSLSTTMESMFKKTDKLVSEIKESEHNHFQYTNGRLKDIIDDNIKFYQKTIEAINSFRSSSTKSFESKFNRIFNRLTIIERLQNDIPKINNSYQIKHFTNEGDALFFSDSFFSVNVNNTIDEVISCNEYQLKEEPYYILDENLDENSIVIDIGANLGIFSIYLAKKFPGIKIIAIEPIKRTYKFLLKNIIDNNLTYDQIIPLNLAIVGIKKEEKEKIVYLENNPGSSFLLGKLASEKEKLYYNKSNKREVYEVNSITLEELFSEFNIEKCHLLKIDCEGSEKEIFENSVIFNKVDKIIGEIHYSQYNEDIIETFIKKYPNININLERV